jgi:hypothetical protein
MVQITAAVIGLYIIPAYIAWRLFLVMLRQVVAVVRGPAQATTVTDDMLVL